MINIDKKAKYLLLGYSEYLIENFYILLDVWPDRDKCRKALLETELYSEFEIIFVGQNEGIENDYRKDRLIIYYDENDKITLIEEE